jgi:hypothetical protein
MHVGIGSYIDAHGNEDTDDHSDGNYDSYTDADHTSQHSGLCWRSPVPNA